ncbi:MAG: hypothetical protein OIF32_10610, partial [Campylobacterales bacterium]|nr:hypothetical protein [Campylobacterales bacterium]
MFIKFFSIIFVITLFFGCQSSDSSSTNNDTTIENPSIIVEAVTMNIITVTSNPIQKNNRAIIIGTATNSKEKISFRINSRDYSAEPNDEGNWSITTEELTDSSYHIDFYNDGIVNGTLFQYNNSFIINSQNLIIDTTPPNATLPAIFTQAPI